MTLDNQVSVLSRDERDLLIRLDTKMTGMETQLKEMAGNYTARLLNLEGNAVTKVVHDSDIKDHEDRLRWLEHRGWMLSGGVLTISTVFTFFLKFFAK